MTTNVRGRFLDEFIASNLLQIINEESDWTIFHSSRGQSNIDITITDIRMLTAIDNWEISEEERASDHNIIKIHIKLGKDEEKITRPPGFKLIIKEQKRAAFYEKIYSTISKKFQVEGRREGQEGINEELSRWIKVDLHIRQFTTMLEDAIQTACREIYRFKEKSKPKPKGRVEPWWTEELTTMKNRTNVLRRRFQRTTNNEDLRESRKRQYKKAKADFHN